MVDNEKIKSILMLYKQDKISEYVLERELGEYFGDLVRIQIEKESTTGKTSYCIFAIPELKKEGFRILFIIDKNALKNIYKEDEFVVVCERLKNKLQNILKRYHSFRKETSDSEVSMNHALGFLLSLYSSYYSDLLIGNREYLPEEDDIMKYTDLFTMEEANSEDLETVKIKGILSNTIIDAAKVYVKFATGLKLNFASTEVEKPVFNLGQQEIIKHCTSTFGVRDHKEIPYDYLPKTNQ